MESYNLTEAEASKLSMTEITAELRKRAKLLEEQVGMTHEEACEFLSGIMNLGIASKKKWELKKAACK